MIKHSSSKSKFSFSWNNVLHHRLHKALLLLPLLRQFGPAHSTTCFSKFLLYFYFTNKKRVYPWQTTATLRPEVSTTTATCFLAGAKSRSNLPEYAQLQITSCVLDLKLCNELSKLQRQIRGLLRFTWKQAVASPPSLVLIPSQLTSYGTYDKDKPELRFSYSDLENEQGKLRLQKDR